MKPFKTYDEQITILKSRNLIINDENRAKEILAQNNYYNLINGYKSVFLEKDINENFLQPEKYIENSTLEELYYLYLMDQELKSLIFKYLLRFEKLLKSYIAYQFSEKYNDDYSYLTVKNYSSRTEDLNKVLKNIAILSGTINRENKKSGKPAINHYTKNHNNVPLWVLVNFLTFGQISYFYQAIDENLRNDIARKFGEKYKTNYNTNEKISDGEMKQIIKLIRYFRNSIAHDEVIFSFKVRKSESIALFSKFFGENVYKGKKLFDLILILKLVIPKEEYTLLISDIEHIFDNYKAAFK